MKRSFFVGIPLSQRISELLTKAIKPVSTFEDSFYWIPQQNWHITLAFLGNLTDTELESVKTVLTKYVTQQRYFNIYFNGISLFPPKQPKKGVVTMVKNRNLMDFQFGLRQALEKALPSFAPENTFQPHVSVMNIKRGKTLELLHAKMHELVFKRRFEITDIALMETIVHEKPPVSYSPVHEVRLLIDDKFQESESE